MAQSGDWSAQTADTIESVVENIRTKTAVPLTTVARGLVYGLVATVMALAALVLVTILLVRILDAYIPGGVWIVDVGLGGLFTLGGAFLWSKRSVRPKD